MQKKGRKKLRFLARGKTPFILPNKWNGRIHGGETSSQNSSFLKKSRFWRNFWSGIHQKFLQKIPPSSFLPLKRDTLIAAAAGREIGKIGRPTKLNEEQIKIFIDIVNEELQKGSEINYDLAILLVYQ